MELMCLQALAEFLQTLEGVLGEEEDLLVDRVVELPERVMEPQV